MFSKEDEAVKQTLQNRIRPASLTIPFLRILSMLVFGLTMLSVAARGATQYTSPMQNSFSEYADILPGNPQRNLPTDTCQPSSTSPVQETCVLAPAEGAFLRIQILISRGTISQTMFIVRENSLKVGDLENFLGKRAIYIKPQLAIFYLPEERVIADTYVGRFSRFLNIKIVTFTDEIYFDSN